MPPDRLYRPAVGARPGWGHTPRRRSSLGRVPAAVLVGLALLFALPLYSASTPPTVNDVLGALATPGPTPGLAAAQLPAADAAALTRLPDPEGESGTAARRPAPPADALTGYVVAAPEGSPHAPVRADEVGLAGRRRRALPRRDRPRQRSAATGSRPPTPASSSPPAAATTGSPAGSATSRPTRPASTRRSSGRPCRSSSSSTTGTTIGASTPTSGRSSSPPATSSRRATSWATRAGPGGPAAATSTTRSSAPTRPPSSGWSRSPRRTCSCRPR